jgi:hypothetical protein
VQHLPITYVLFLGSATLETDLYSFRKHSRRTDFENVISLIDIPDLHPDTTIMLTEEEKIVYITWWNTVAQDQLCVLSMKVTNYNGQTFGSLVMFSANWTVNSDVDIATTSEEEEEERRDTGE